MGGGALGRLAVAVTLGLLLGAASGLAPAGAAGAKAAEESAWVYLPNGIRQDGQPVDDLLRQVMEEQAITHPPLAGEFPHGLKVELVRGPDIFELVNRLHYLRGWTDGLPIVPPTAERVRAMLRGTDRPPGEVVAVLEPMKGLATVEKVAVNAVMAGCSPQHLPVVLAAVEAVADPEFNLLGVQTTTNPDAPLILLNGPITAQIGVNCSTNCFGPGWQANAAIGRALRLVLNNIGGGWPGVSDMADMGWPGKYTLFAAENEAESPWEPLHVELGFAADQNVVTVVPAEGMHGVISISRNSEQFLQAVADHMAGLDRAERREMLLLLTPDTAAMLARDGYTKESIRAYLAEHAVMPLEKYREKFIIPKGGTISTGVAKALEQQREDPVLGTVVPVPMLDRLLIVVAGGPGEKNMIVPIWAAAAAVSREVRLPKDWERVLAEAETAAAGTAAAR